MNLNTRTFVSSAVAMAAGIALYSCGNSYTPPVVAFPTVVLLEGADAGAPLSCPSTDGGTLVANGVAVAVLRISNTNGASVAPDKYQIVVASTDGKVTFGLPVLVGEAGVLQASSVVTIPVSLPGQQNDILVHAGTESGDAHIAVTVGSETKTYCLPLARSEPEAVSVQVATAGGAPANWAAFQISVSLGGADGGQVSDAVPLLWSATGCALFAADKTYSSEHGMSQNTVYLPPGWSQSEVTVNVVGGPTKVICLTPHGAVAPIPLDGGACPAIQVPDAGGDASAGLTIVCPVLQ
jgi:hypothetical protein